MLSKFERIKYRGLFLQAYEKGRKLDSKHLRITFTKSRADLEDKLPLVGFTITKKFSKRAVLRNKIKRRLREAYRLYRLEPKAQAELKKIGLLIIQSKNSITKADLASEEYSFKSLEAELRLLLDQAVSYPN